MLGIIRPRGLERLGPIGVPQTRSAKNCPGLPFRFAPFRSLKEISQGPREQFVFCNGSDGTGWFSTRFPPLLNDKDPKIRSSKGRIHTVISKFFILKSGSGQFGEEYRFGIIHRHTK